MKASIDISLYPLTEDYLPAIQTFISNLSQYDDIAITRNDLSTQMFGDYDRVMDILKQEIRLSWETYGKGIFVVKFLLDDQRGLADD